MVGKGVFIGACLMAFCLADSTRAQGPDISKPVDENMQAEIIDSVTAALNEVYVFPDVAKKMEQHLRRQYKEKAYREITSIEDFAARLTEDLQSISHDRHLGVQYVPDEYFARLAADTLTDSAGAADLANAQDDNFGWRELKWLPGNIGYVKFNYFADTKDAGGTAIAAMNFLAYCDAIIFDLRENGGGQPSMIQLISSYFFDEVKHLNSFYIRKEDTIQQFWTQEYVQGPRMSDAEIFVLTSNFTFSGAEEFTYNMKNMKRGTIIGETTGGGAHPVDRRGFANLNIGMSLPFGRAINPISGTNWEGTGVEPDIAVPAAEALDVAIMEAAKKLLAKTDNEDRKFQLQWIIAGKEAERNPVTLTPAELQPLVGTYGPRAITLENRELYYQRQDRPKYRLIPMGNDTFMLDGLDSFRLQFGRDQAGAVTEIIGLYNDGQKDGSPKDK